MPDVPVSADGVARAVELTDRAESEAVALEASGRGAADAARFRAMFTAARSEDWTKFLGRLRAFEAEIAEEIRIGKFTMAELKEE